MYKDKNKQREAQRNWVRQKRAVKGSTEQGSTDVIFRPACVTCKDMVNSNGIATCDIGGCDKPIPKERLEAKPVGSKVPLDQAFIPEDKRKQVRGKDIKCFADLPPDVQATIDRISESNEEKAKRTKAAIKYQHLFPDRFHSAGVDIS